MLTLPHGGHMPHQEGTEPLHLVWLDQYQRLVRHRTSAPLAVANGDLQASSATTAGQRLNFQTQQQPFISSLLPIALDESIYSRVYFTIFRHGRLWECPEAEQQRQAGPAR
jgi:hypothetical protein